MYFGATTFLSSSFLRSPLAAAFALSTVPIEVATALNPEQDPSLSWLLRGSGGDGEWACWATGFIGPCLVVVSAGCSALGGRLIEPFGFLAGGSLASDSPSDESELPELLPDLLFLAATLSIFLAVEVMALEIAGAR